MGLTKEKIIAKVNGNSDKDQTIENSLKNTPKFPDELFELIPYPFSKISLFYSNRNRDAILISMLVIVGSILRNCNFNYGKKHYFNLLLIIGAPAASGKGSIELLKKITDPIHKQLRVESNTINKKSGKKDNGVKEKKVQLLHHLPGNISASGCLKIAADNKGYGLIFETEVDVINSVLKLEYGNYSSLLRQSFHNEHVSIYRKTEDEYNEVDSIILSMVLTGTINQIFEFISSEENGLLSRIMFYFYSSKSEWINMFDWNIQEVERELEIVSNEYLKLWNELKDKELIFHLSKNQEESFQDHMDRLYKITINSHGEDAGQIVFRAAIFCMRIAGIFSISENWFTSHDCPKKILCSDSNLESALSITNILVQHSCIFFDELSSVQYNRRFFKGIPENKINFYQSLPMEFRRKKAIEIAKSNDISVRATDEFLKNASLFIHKKHGIYKKLIE